jgi:Predicted membrane protein
MQGSRRVGAAAGFAAPVVAFVFISAAIASYPSFSWTGNALSDLGVVPGLTGALFTVGLCGGGILTLVFAALGLYGYAGDKTVGKAGAAFFAAAAFSLILIGVFNEHYRPTHYVVSVAFFASAPLAFFILTAALYLKRQRGLAAYTIVTGLVAAIPWILQLTVHYVPEVAIPEAVSGLTAAVWVVVLSKLMLKPKV